MILPLMWRAAGCAARRPLGLTAAAVTPAGGAAPTAGHYFRRASSMGASSSDFHGINWSVTKGTRGETWRKTEAGLAVGSKAAADATAAAVGDGLPRLVAVEERVPRKRLGSAFKARW